MRGIHAVSAIVLLLAPFGCASVLGDFTQSASAPGDDGGGGSDSGSPPLDGLVEGDSSAPVPDGGADAPQSDVASPSDAADASLELLICNAWKSSTPTTVFQTPPSDAGNNNNTPINRVYLEHIGAIDSARIVVQTNTSTGSSTTVYTIPEQGGGTPQSTVFPNTNLQSEGKTTGATTILVQQFMNGNQLAYYQIQDNDQGGEADAGPPVASIGNPPSEGNGNFNVSFVETSVSQLYTLASYTTTTAGQYEVASWVPPSSNWGILLTGQQLQVGSSSLVPSAGNDIYGFLPPLGTPNGGGPAPISQFTFNGSTPPTSRSVTGTGETGAPIAAATTSTGDFELAFLTINGAQTAGLNAGVVPASAINTFVIDDLPPFTFKPGGDAGFFDTTPFGGNNGPGGRWLSNGDFAIMGSGGTGGGGYTGLNFYVGTANGQWIVQTAGTGQNVLPGHTVIASAFDLQQAVSDILLTFDLAWVEQLADGTTVLYFNQLNCQL
jgi:hypothetical protein